MAMDKQKTGTKDSEKAKDTKKNVTAAKKGGTDATEDEETKDGKVNKEVWEYIKMIIFVVIAVFLINQFILINARIPSESMENTIMTGDQIFGNRLAYVFSEPKRFDIVIFRYPDNEEELFIKRIIGMPGDKVKIVDGKVYINDAKEPLDDSFIKEPPRKENFPAPESGLEYYEVPDDSYFMMGDNRNNSKDSRYWTNTYVHKSKILGEAWLRYLPINKFGIIDSK